MEAVKPAFFRTRGERAAGQAGVGRLWEIRGGLGGPLGYTDFGGLVEVCRRSPGGRGSVMRIVCLVPSWTESLVEAGANVVGRTRYCVHPRERVADIAVVGGTRDVDWAGVRAVEPDLLVLDRQENPRSIAEQSPVPWVATEVISVESAGRELDRLGDRLKQPELSAMAERWRKVCARFARVRPDPGWLELPGVLEWVRPPGSEVERFACVIWKDPWKVVGSDTFVGSMFDVLGYGSRMLRLQERYPDVRLEDLDPRRTLLLFASEPYPFAGRGDILAELPFASAIVDGECYSWFGLRALRFLERCAPGSPD